jgi:quercetin dioxygenase-like cupin family protein
MHSSPLLLVVLLTSVATATTALAQSTAANAVPVHREPRHHVVYENALARIIDVRVPAGDTTEWHVHADRMLTVVIAGARTWNQAAGHEPTAAGPGNAVGSVGDNYGSLPLTHRVGNVDTVAFHYVAGVVKRRTGITAPALGGVAHLALERDTAGARVYRVTLAPGEATTSHRHASPGLTVQVGPGHVRAEGMKPQRSSTASGAGAWWWRAAGQTHLLRNLGDAPVQLVEIDWP